MNTWSFLSRRIPVWLLLLLLLLITEQVCAFNIVVDGSGGGLEVQLIAGKLATRAGNVCHIMTATDEKSVRRNRALMYGPGDATPTPTSIAGPLFVSDPEDIGNALSNANGLILLSIEDKALPESKVDIFLRNTPQLSHVALLSQIGGVHRKLEEHLEAACRARSVACSIIRTGILKGGGPGDGGGGGEDRDHEDDWGLDKFYYSTLFELMLAQNTMAFDRFTLGVKVVAGDVYKAPNFFAKLSANQSFDPSDFDTGRSAAAAALLAVLERPTGGVDVSLSTAKSTVPPTMAEWEELLSSVSSL
jgi:hypothetical protein